jgi:toxin YoeB
MEIILLQRAKEHLNYWEKTNNKIVLKRISMLIRAIINDPYVGIGKPELLKHELSGKWSRRIDKENRIVYGIVDSVLYIYTLKGHY